MSRDVTLTHRAVAPAEVRERQIDRQAVDKQANRKTGGRAFAQERRRITHTDRQALMLLNAECHAGSQREDFQNHTQERRKNPGHFHKYAPNVCVLCVVWRLLLLARAGNSASASDFNSNSKSNTDTDTDNENDNDDYDNDNDYTTTTTTTTTKTTTTRVCSFLYRWLTL